MTTIFDLSEQLLAQAEIAVTESSGLTEESLEHLNLVVESEELDSETERERLEARGGSTCIACGIGVTLPAFASVEEQREHFRTDWHRYNVKRRVAGLAPVAEERFTALVVECDDEVGSLSGSDSDASADEAASVAVKEPTTGPQLRFSLPDGRQCAVWRCLVSPEQGGAGGGVRDPPPSDSACLQRLRELRGRGSSRWGVVLSRGGHFAAAVFDVTPSTFRRHPLPTAACAAAEGGRGAEVQGGGGKVEKGGRGEERGGGPLEALLHKSFHRYVVRQGQGGRQSSKDSSKYAKSAGSRLRRHNEAALERDIRDTLAQWREALGTCQAVFVHAPGSNSLTLFGGQDPPLDRADPRIRRIPFTTRRPTYSEAKRVLRMLASLYVVDTHTHTQQQQQQHEEEAGQTPTREGLPPCEPQPAAAAAKASMAGHVGQAAAVAAGGSTSTSDSSVLTAAAAHAAEAAAARKKADKRARQKARQKESRASEAAASRAAAELAASEAAEDEISRAAARAAALASRPTPKPGAGAARTGAGPSPKSAEGGQPGKASAAAPPPRLSAKPRADEDPSIRRARAAAAAEARMKALQAAAAQQQLY